jgi:hypothetical protein
MAASTAARVAPGTWRSRPAASVNRVATPRARAARRSSSSVMAGEYGTLSPTMSIQRGP